MIIQAGLGSSILYIAIVIILAILSQADKQRKNKGVRKNPTDSPSFPSGKNTDIYNQVAHLLNLPVEEPIAATEPITAQEIKKIPQPVTQVAKEIENIKINEPLEQKSYLEILEEKEKDSEIKEEGHKQLIENFDVKKAVIYSEIFNPKYF